MKILVLIFLIVLNVQTFAFELATKIYQEGTTAVLQTTGYAKVPLLKQEVSLKGAIVATGVLNIKGAANIVMWSKVDGVYYFTKMPNLQNIIDVKNLSISIPFNAGDKTVTEVLIEVESLIGGSVSIGDLSVKGSE
ncbi:MAG: hypothetical protein PVJ68_02040 [Candidatus Thiodiazotropha sp.]|jgi:hypothetical protein